MNAILAEQSLNLPTIQGASPILVQLVKHVIDDVVSFHLVRGLVVVVVSVFLRSGFKPLFVQVDLKLE